MAAVKSLVVFMGVLIVLGLGLFGYGMMRVSDDLRAEGGAGLPGFGDVVLDAPVGTSIAAATGDGQGRLLLRLTGGGRPDRVVVIDAATGQRLGAIILGAMTLGDGAAR